jgi:glycosyltransferase involved in cell wall biosynthesis
MSKSHPQNCKTSLQIFLSTFKLSGITLFSLELWILLLTILLLCAPPSFLITTYDSSVEGKFGVNAYGWIRGDFGGGTTARCVISSLFSQSIPLAAVAIGGADQHSHTNTMVSSLGIQGMPQDYVFDIFLINAANTLPVLRNRSNQISDRHYRIGLWHWETSYLPSDQGDAGKYYDEIWAPSTYVAQAILRTPSFPRSVGVKVIPYGYETLPIHVTDDIRRIARSQLHSLLPVDGDTGVVCARCTENAAATLARWSSPNSTTTLFLMIFDFNSDYNRKNILGAVDVFLSAFSDTGHTSSDDVGLIIKSSNARHQSGDYDHLKWVLGNKDIGGKRIVLLDGVLPYSQLVTLKSVPDCYLSLHRSEGWGLNILEGVLMGVPVIATAYGGSEQFMHPLYDSTAPELRIPYQLVNVSASSHCQ